MERTAKCGCFISGAIQMCPTHAAAPELLDMLEICLDSPAIRHILGLNHEYDPRPNPRCHCSLCDLEAAVAKAKGEA